MEPTWKRNLALLHKKKREVDNSHIGDDSYSGTKFAHGLETAQTHQSSRGIFGNDSIISAKNSKLDIWNGSLFKDFNLTDGNSFLNDINCVGIIDLQENSRRDDSGDNVNQGTPTKIGSEGGSSRSTPSSNERLRPDFRGIGTGLKFLTDYSKLTDHNSEIIDDTDLFYADVGDQSFNSGISSEKSNTNIIKTLDFGSSMEHKEGIFYNSLIITGSPDNKPKGVTSDDLRSNNEAVKEKALHRIASTPPRDISPYRPILAAKDIVPLKPPTASCPSSPDLKGINGSFNKTPSRIPLPSSRGTHSATRVSPTQERSTSKFADALRKHGCDEEEQVQEQKPSSLVGTVNPPVVQQQKRVVGIGEQTPISKASTRTVEYTPASTVAVPPPTPMTVTPAAAQSDLGLDTALTLTRTVVDESAISLDRYDEWKEAWTPIGKKYFYNRKTRKSAWRLPPTAVYVKVSQEQYKIFVPCDSVGSDSTSQILTPSTVVRDLTVNPSETNHDNNLGISATGSTVSSHKRQNYNFPIQAFDGSVSSKKLEQVPELNPDEEWGGMRHTFVKIDKPIINSRTPDVVLMIAEQKTELVSKPSITANNILKTKHDDVLLTVPTNSDKFSLKTKESTRMYCPLCIDTMTPSTFADHFTECSEMHKLFKNGEWKLVSDALERGAKIMRNNISTLSDQTNKIDAQKDEISPLLQRSLNFEMNSAKPRQGAKSAVELETAFNLSVKELGETVKMVGNGSDALVIHNKCPFCKRVCSKSALSAHLLSCKVRKEARNRREMSNTVVISTSSVKRIPEHAVSPNRTIRSAVSHPKSENSGYRHSSAPPKVRSNNGSTENDYGNQLDGQNNEHSKFSNDETFPNANSLRTLIGESVIEESPSGVSSGINSGSRGQMSVRITKSPFKSVKKQMFGSKSDNIRGLKDRNLNANFTPQSSNTTRIFL